MTTGIYNIVLRETGHRYIGGAKNCKARLRFHRQRLEAGRSHNKVLQFAWDVFGPDAFDFVVVETCTEEELDAVELRHLRGANGPLFNILRDARRPPPVSEETRLILSAKARAQHAAGSLGRQAWKQ